MTSEERFIKFRGELKKLILKHYFSEETGNVLFCDIQMDIAEQEKIYFQHAYLDNPHFVDELMAQELKEIRKEYYRIRQSKIAEAITKSCSFPSETVQ
jgi:hypothetical protein